MAYHHGTSRRDENHAACIKAARDEGAYIMDCANDRNGYDYIAIFRGKVTFCEVKVTDMAKLTDIEQVARINIIGAGGRYRVVITDEDAREALK
jgi:hypothetical protein